MAMGMVVPVRMPVVVGTARRLTMSVVVMVGVGRSGNHARMLYYNITHVHGRLGVGDRANRRGSGNLPLPAGEK